MKLPEEDLAGYIESYLKRSINIKRAIDSHFQGTITDVTQVAVGNFLVSIERTEGLDNHQYLCVIPGYIPRIGDVVDCEWRDSNTGYVKYVLQSAFPPGSGIFFDLLLTDVLATITIPDIPQDYFQLEVIYTAKTDQSAALVQFIDWIKNGVVTATYDMENQTISGVAAVAPGEVRSASAGRCGVATGPNAAANRFAHGEFKMEGYSDSISAKKLRWDAEAIYNTTAGSIQKYFGVSDARDNTDPITQLDLTLEGGGNFIAGTRVIARVR